MKIVLSIARTELRILLCSPIAWVIIAVFLLQTGLAYVSGLHSGLLLLLSGHEPQLTKTLFSGQSSTYIIVASNIRLYAPLITMGLLSREFDRGSIKLLYSSPVGLSSLVLGKYLAAVAYCSVLIAILGLFVFGSYVLVENLDVWLALSGLVGIFLLACAYCAVGLFMSSLTKYQIVAAISTLAALTCFEYVGKFAHGIPIMEDITYWLSLPVRIFYFQNGLIASFDAMYFFLIIIFFIALTIIVLSYRGAGLTRRSAAFAVAGLLAVTIGVGQVSTLPRFAFYRDMTREKEMSLTAASESVIRSLNHSPWRVTVFVNVLDRDSFRFVGGNRKELNRYLFGHYIRVNPNLTVGYRFFYENVPGIAYLDAGLGKKDVTPTGRAKDFATQHGLDFVSFLSPAEMTKLVDMGQVEHRTFFLVEYQGKSTVVRTFDDNNVLPGEREITAAVKGLAAGKVNVKFVSGHGERSSYQNRTGDFSQRLSARLSRAALVNHGFVFEDITLEGGVPDGTDLLVIADPQRQYAAGEIASIKSYLDAGRNLLIVGEGSLPALLTSLRPAVRVNAAEEVLREPKQDYPDDLIFAELGAPIIGADPQGWTRSNKPIVLPGVVSLDPDKKAGFIVSAFLKSHGGQPVGLALERRFRGHAQRIMIVGDADFMSNSEAGRRNPSTSNGRVINEAFLWLSNGKFPIDTVRPDFIDRSIAVELKDVVWFKLIILFAAPLLLLFAGGMILYVRRRR